MNIKVLPVIAALIVGCQPNTSAQSVKREFSRLYNTEYPPKLGTYKCSRFKIIKTDRGSKTKIEIWDTEQELTFTLLSDDTYE